jgi:hypothetical protein
MGIPPERQTKFPRQFCCFLVPLETQLTCAAPSVAGLHRVAWCGLTKEEAKMCKVLNAKRAGKNPGPGCVYVGRPSRWGNPFVIGRHGTRDEVIAKYRAWVLAKPGLMAALDELRGKNLVCWCAPERCHADVLLELCGGSD